MDRKTVERFRDGTFASLDAPALRRVHHALLHLDAEDSQREQLLDELAACLPTLRQAPRGWAAEFARVSPRTIKNVLGEHSQPGPALTHRLIEIARALDADDGDPRVAARTLQGMVRSKHHEVMDR
jgi:hypothetical protein